MPDGVRHIRLVTESVHAEHNKPINSDFLEKSSPYMKSWVGGWQQKIVGFKTIKNRAGGQCIFNSLWRTLE
jgi:hypothetical protein